MSIAPEIPYIGDIQQRVSQQMADLQRKLAAVQANDGGLPPAYVNGTNIAANTIAANNIVAGTITSNEIAAGTIVATNIAALAITTGLLAAGAVTAAKIAANTITASQIASHTITANELTATAIDGMTITGSTIQTSATANTTGAGVVITTLGISAYDATHTRQVYIDSTTGLIQARGVLLATTGSDIPTATISGLLPGSNRYSNSNFQQGQSLFDTTGWSFTNCTAADGGTTVQPVYGARTMKLTATSAIMSVNNSTTTDAYRRVLPGLNYTFSHYVNNTAASARLSTVNVSWYAASGTLLSTSSGTTVSVAAGQWTRVSLTFQAPANAAYAQAAHYIATNATVSDVFYVNAFQMEEGDRVSAYAPRSDEVLINQINANNINVANLAAISANLGTITSGLVTGATVQTATSGARLVMDTSGLTAYSSDGDPTFVLGSDGSLAINYNVVPNGQLNADIDGWKLVQAGTNPGGLAWLSPGEAYINAPGAVAAQAGYGTPAIPVIPGDTYTFRVQIASGNATGTYIVRMFESSAATLGTGYIGTQPDVDAFTSYTDLDSASMFTGALVQKTYTYTVPAGVHWVTVAMFNWGGVDNFYFALPTMRRRGAAPAGMIRAGSFIGGMVKGSTISAAVIKGSVVEGGILQTSASGTARVVIGTFGVGYIQFQDAAGNVPLQIDPTNGVVYKVGSSAYNSISWKNASGTQYGELYTDNQTGSTGGLVGLTANRNSNSNGTIGSYLQLGADNGSTNYNYVACGAYSSINFAAQSITIIDAIGNSSFVKSTSDAKLKRDILDLPSSDALARIRQLKPSSFTWRDTSRHDLGLIAQDVATIVPEAVQPVTRSDGEELTLQHGPILALLVGAVQELNGRGVLDTNALWTTVLEAADFADAQARLRREILHQLEAEHFDRHLHGLANDDIETLIARVRSV